MTNKLYLINPPDKGMLSGFPGALLFLSAWVKMNVPDVDVKYVDLSISKKDRKPLNGAVEDILNELDEYELEAEAIYGITATTATYQNALRAAQAIKQKNSYARIILGGHHSMHEAEIILERHPEIDFCATGEGERTLADILRGTPINEVRGIVYKDLIFGLIKRNRASYLSREELDKFAFGSFDWTPIIDSLEDEKVRGQFGYFDINTARGCNLKCSFCTFGDDQLRDMSPEAKARLLFDMVNSEIYRHAGGINIHDNDFAQNTQKTHELCDLVIDRIINKGYDFKWTIQTRVEHCNERNRDLVEKLAKAGCVEVYYGVENFDPAMAAYLKRVRNTERYLKDTQEAVVNTLAYGIGCNINLQLGIPGETEETRQNNLEALRKVAETSEMMQQSMGSKARIVIYPQLSVIYPGTAMARMPVNGTNKHLPLDGFEVFTQWEWEQEQNGLVEYLGRNFAHGNGGIPAGLIDIGKFVDEKKVIIIPERLNAVNRYLDRMREISSKNPVLTIFDYSSHLHK